MSRVRIGFVGVGNMGQCAHMKNYVSVPDCEVVAIAEVRPELGRAVAARYGVPRVYPTHTEMLRHEELDGIVASQPFTRHGSLLPELLAAGTPLFTEKPLAASIEQAERIVTAGAAGGAMHMVGYHKRCDPAVIFARREIERLKQTGELGALRYVRITMPPGDWVQGGFNDVIRSDEPFPALEDDPPPSDMDAQTYEAYLSFVNYYIHQVNLLRHLLGEPYSVAYADPQGVLLTAVSASGATGVIEMAPYSTSVGWDESALIAFEHGYIRITLPAPLAANQAGAVEVFRDAAGETPSTFRPHLPPVHAIRQQAIQFVRAIRGIEKPPCSADEALEDLKAARDYIRLKTGK